MNPKPREFSQDVLDYLWRHDFIQHTEHKHIFIRDGIPFDLSSADLMKIEEIWEKKQFAHPAFLEDEANFE